MSIAKIISLALLSLVVLSGCISAPTDVNPPVTITIRTTTTTLSPIVQELRDTVATGDIKQCDRLEQGQMSESCKRDIAVNTKNPDLCASITDQLKKDTCYYRNAYTTKTKALCDKVSDEKLKADCIKRTT